LGNKRDANKLLVRKLEDKRPLEKTRCRCEVTVSMNVKEMFCADVDWTHLIPACMKTVVRGSKKGGIFSLAALLLASEEEIYFMGLELFAVRFVATD